MTAILKQMDDMHYAHYIGTFKTRQDIIVSVVVLPLFLVAVRLSLEHPINNMDIKPPRPQDY